MVRLKRLKIQGKLVMLGDYVVCKGMILPYYIMRHLITEDDVVRFAKEKEIVKLNLRKK